MINLNYNNSEYLSGKHASNILGVHQRTLYQWEKKGYIKTIRSPGNIRLYNVKQFLADKKDKIIKNEYNGLEKQCKLKIIYARVSSTGQKNDLERQKQVLIELYPNYMLIEDIGSGMNLNRRGLRKIIDWAIQGKIQEVVVMYKDRLARFGYELIEDLILKYSNGKITVVNKKINAEPEDELVQDVLQVMNIFVARMNGIRKYRKNH